MSTRIGIVNLNGCSYELAYDLLSQNNITNSSNVRIYGILHVSNYYVSWSSGSASVHTSGLQSIGTYYATGDYVIIQRDFTFYHDEKGKFSNWIGGSLITTFTSGETGGYMTLPDIVRQATIKNANDINDEENPYFSFSNIGGFDLVAELEINPTNTHILSRSISNTESYTFDLTDEERKLMRSYSTKSNTAKLRYLLYSNNKQFVSYVDKTYTIINANPIFNNFEFEDINPITLNLTGNKKYNIDNYSNIKIIISSIDKAIPLKEATMKKYRYVIGNVSKDLDYSDSEEITDTINNSINGIYNIYAIDSRNNSTLVTKLSEKEINYTPIYINKQNCSIIRNNNNVGQEAILKLNGTFWNDTFGKVTNTIKSVTYKLKKSNSSQWIDGKTNIQLKTNENNFSFEGNIASDNENTFWDLNESYNVQVTISDELSTSTVDLILNSAIPTLSMDKEGVGIMCSYDRSLGGYLQVNGKVFDEDKKIFKFLKIEKNVTVKGNVFESHTMIENYNSKQPIGYEYLGIITNYNGYGDQWLVSYARYGSSIVAMTYSKWDGDLNSDLICTVVFVKKEYLDNNIIE